MRSPVTEFLSVLQHEHLAARGFKRARHTFSRPRDGYVERIQFQGRAWNNANGSWHFYVNFGVEFADLPSRGSARDFPATHCWARIEDIVPDAPQRYDARRKSAGKCAAEIAGYVDRASRAVARRIRHIRCDYETTKLPWIVAA